MIDIEVRQFKRASFNFRSKVIPRIGETIVYEDEKFKVDNVQYILNENPTSISYGGDVCEEVILNVSRL